MKEFFLLKDDTSDRFELLPIPFGSRIYHTSADLLVSSSQPSRDARSLPLCISITTGVAGTPLESQDSNPGRSVSMKFFAEQSGIAEFRAASTTRPLKITKKA